MGPRDRSWQRTGHWRLELKRFRGAVCSSRWERGAFWHHLDVDASAVVFWTLLGDDVRVERDTVDRVEFERIHLPPFWWWVTNARFRRADGRWSSRFVPWRPGRLQRALEGLGWPVTTVPKLGYRQLLAERAGNGEAAST
jgi:hypothetical protein